MKKVLPRAVPSRDDFYMGLAFCVSGRSKDRDTQCGSVIISCDNSPLGMGYNGPPRQINDNDVSWERPEKYFTMVHSEVNAIQYSRGDTEGSTLYVTAKPCPACMLSIVSAGISRVVWFPKNITDSSSMLANNDKSAQTDDIAKKGKVTLEVFKGNLNWLKDWVNQLD